MATKDISDVDVLLAYGDAKALRESGTIVVWPEDLLTARLEQHEKVCLRAMERACKRGLIEYGVSLHAGWITDDGRRVLQEFYSKGEGEQPWQQQ